MATYRELKAQAEVLLQQAEDLRKQELESTIEDIRRKMTEYGIRIDDLRTSTAKAGQTRKPTGGKKAAIKYRDKSGNTWSGRGLKPKWLKKALEDGRKLEDYAV